MSFIKNDPKMMATLIRTQQHPSQQQQMSMQQNMINQQGSNMGSQLSQNQNWYGPSQAQSQRMINPGQRQLNPQTSPRASMMMNTVQNQAPSQASQHQQVYPNQQQQIRFSSTNWSGNSQQQSSQPQRMPMLRGNPSQMNQMNTVRFINAQNTSGGMMNSQNDTSQEMFYQQSDYGQMSMNQQPELTPQEKLSKYVEDL